MSADVRERLTTWVEMQGCDDWNDGPCGECLPCMVEALLSTTPAVPGDPWAGFEWLRDVDGEATDRMAYELTPWEHAATRITEALKRDWNFEDSDDEPLWTPIYNSIGFLFARPAVPEGERLREAAGIDVTALVEKLVDQPKRDHLPDGSLRCNLCWRGPCACGVPELYRKASEALRIEAADAINRLAALTTPAGTAELSIGTPEWFRRFDTETLASFSEVLDSILHEERGLPCAECYYAGRAKCTGLHLPADGERAILAAMNDIEGAVNVVYARLADLRAPATAGTAEGVGERERLRLLIEAAEAEQQRNPTQTRAERIERYERLLASTPAPSEPTREEIMSDYREAYREELEETEECPLHPGSRMNPSRGVPCTCCEDGEPTRSEPDGEVRVEDAALSALNVAMRTMQDLRNALETEQQMRANYKSERDALIRRLASLQSRTEPSEPTPSRGAREPDAWAVEYEPGRFVRSEKNVAVWFEREHAEREAREQGRWPGTTPKVVPVYFGAAPSESEDALREAFTAGWDAYWPGRPGGSFAHRGGVEGHRDEQKFNAAYAEYRAARGTP